MECCCGSSARAARLYSCEPVAHRHAPALVQLARRRAPVLLKFDPLKLGRTVCQAAASSSAGSEPGDMAERMSNSSACDMMDDALGRMPEFCIIESSDTVRDFDRMQLSEIGANIAARRNRIFLLMEEVRRLRIQQRLKGGNVPKEVDLAQEPYTSALPFLPPLTRATLNAYYTAYATFAVGIILFGALLAPILEVRLGVGGTSYLEFVQSLHLPSQLAEVDPIVASFCGGGVGVLSALMVVEINNVEKQEKGRCAYCEGTGYLMCGNCVGAGLEPLTQAPCSCCSGTGKVMCTGCLCTGKAMATEHDERLDPFS